MLNAVKGEGLLAVGTGVGEKAAAGRVGVGRARVGVGEGAAAGVGVGVLTPEGALGLERTKSFPPVDCLSSVWKVPVLGLNTSSLEKLGPTWPGAAADPELFGAAAVGVDLG